METIEVKGKIIPGEGDLVIELEEVVVTAPRWNAYDQWLKNFMEYNSNSISDWLDKASTFSDALMTVPNPGAIGVGELLKGGTAGAKGLLNVVKSLSRAEKAVDFVPGASKAEFKFTSKLEEHIIKTDTSVPRSRGVGGAHNLEEFSKNDVNIVNTINHPTIDGIKTVEYQIPALDGKTGEVIGWKSQVYKKTVYDPNIISDQQFIQWGKEAASEAASAGQLTGREWSGTASNGLKFRGYLDDTGEVTSFFPEF